MPRAAAFLLLAMQYYGAAAEPKKVGKVKKVEKDVCPFAGSLSSDRSVIKQECYGRFKNSYHDASGDAVEKLCGEAKGLDGGEGLGRKLGTAFGCIEDTLREAIDFCEYSPLERQGWCSDTAGTGTEPFSGTPKYVDVCSGVVSALCNIASRQLAPTPGKRYSADANPTKVRAQDADDRTLADSTPARENNVNMLLAIAVVMLSLALLLHAVAATMSRCQASAPENNVAAREVVQEHEMEPEAGSPAALKKNCDSV